MALRRKRETHHHHECITEGRGQRWLLDTMRVSLLDDHVDPGGEDVFVQGEVPVVAAVVPSGQQCTQKEVQIMSLGPAEPEGKGSTQTCISSHVYTRWFAPDQQHRLGRDPALYFS